MYIYQTTVSWSADHCCTERQGMPIAQSFYIHPPCKPKNKNTGITLTELEWGLINVPEDIDINSTDEHPKRSYNRFSGPD